MNEERGRKEFLWSRETQSLWSKKKGVFADKMRMAANLDEIIQTTNEVYQETPKHEHKGIEAFNRGKITIQVGSKFYNTDVVTAIKPDGREIFYDIVNINLQKIELPHDTDLKSEDIRGRLWASSSEDTPTHLPMDVRSTLADAQEVSSDTTIAQPAVESKENSEAVQKNVCFQLAEQANRDARKDDQRQASRAIADTAAALDTLSQFFEVTRGVKLSQDSLDGLAARWTKANGSRADRGKLANEARVLAEYLTADGADRTKAQSLAETLAGEVLDGATYRDSELWDEYPDLHKLEYTVNKNGSAKAELVKAYGSWSEAVAEARRHGVTLRQAEGVRDGNPAEQYESVINDTRAVGGIRDGEKAIWKAAAQRAGVDGTQSMESTEWLDVLMNLHDAIKPKMMSRFADDAEYEDARVELAGRMIGDIMNAPEMTDAEAIFEGMQRQGLQMARAAVGTEDGAEAVSQGLKAVQKAQRQEFARRMAENRRTENRNAVKIDGKTFTNLGDVNEYITYQREEFQRQLKQQAQRNAIAIETARQQRDEDVAIAKRVAERRVQKARDARKMDEMRRSIRQNSAQLNQMLLRPSKDKYVQRGLIVQAAEVAKLADQVILNQKAVNQLTVLGGYAKNGQMETLAGMRMWMVRSGSLLVPVPEVERHSRQLQAGSTQHLGVSVSALGSWMRLTTVTAVCITKSPCTAGRGGHSRGRFPGRARLRSGPQRTGWRCWQM